MDRVKTEKQAAESTAGRVLSIPSSRDQLKHTESLFKALGSAKRIEILGILAERACSVQEIARALNMPFTTTSQHVNILERAGLIETTLLPSTRGLKKVCQRVFDRIDVCLPGKSGDSPHPSGPT